jgi:hypothetical protein
MTASAQYERILEECIEAVRSGRMDIDACLRRYPTHAAGLREALTVASALRPAMHAEPRPAFVREARERFLVATGERIEQAYDVEPSPSFFASARFKVLMAAQRMRTEPARPTGPMFSPLMRGVAVAGLVLVLFLGASTYTVASAANALPGDWRYGIKLQTERARLTLALSDDARRDVRLDIAAERASEIERLAARGKIIPPGVIDNMTEQTQRLVADLGDDKLNEDEIERLSAVALRQQAVLEAAKDQVADGAGDELAKAQQVSQDAVLLSVTRLAEKTEGPIHITPAVPLVETETPAPTETAPPTNTPEAVGTADGAPTEAPTTAPPTLEPTPVRNVVSVDPSPVEGPGDIEWLRLALGRFTTLVPSTKHGWTVAGVNSEGTGSASTLIKLSNIDGTSLITINPRNGDTYWHVLANGVFDQIEMRTTRDGQVFVVDPEVVRRIYGAAAEVPLFVTASIEILPEPTPTPVPPTATP